MFHRIKYALDSPIGWLLIAAFALLVGLLALYWYLVYRQKQKDVLLHLHEEYFSKALEHLKEYISVGPAQASFFGRIAPLRNSEGMCYYALIASPYLVDDDSRERYLNYLNTIRNHTLPNFTKHHWTEKTEYLMTLESGLIDNRGKKKVGLLEFLLDRFFSVTETENLLLELSKTLASLHALQTDTGDHLYHGFLLPHLVHLNLEEHNRVRSFIIPYHGLVYSLGPQKIFQQLQAVDNNTLKIESHFSHRLREFWDFIAPEQKDSLRLNEVSRACDFYSFACLAIYLFHKNKWRPSQAIQQDKIPEKWLPFLKACLDTNPKNRPSDFHELQDIIEDPELVLTNFAEEENMPLENTVSLDKPILVDLIAQIKGGNTDAIHMTSALENLISKGNQSLKKGHWEEAQKYFETAYCENDRESEILLGLAISSYELGQEKRAQEYYFDAKKLDPKTAERFRQHLAFRL